MCNYEIWPLGPVIQVSVESAKSVITTKRVALKNSKVAACY